MAKEQKNTWIKRLIAKKSVKRVLSAIGAIVLAIFCVFLGQYLATHHLLSPHPKTSNIISSPNPNPVWNTGSTQSVTIIVTPYFNPPYVRSYTETIPNDNSYKCYMVVQFEASKGFDFMPIEKGGLPDNFSLEAGYEFTNTMKIYIQDFPPDFSYPITLSVYTLAPNTYAGTENITYTVLQVQPE